MKYPSVSRILEATMDPEKRAALEAWRIRVGEEEAERIRQAAMARGNVIDEMVDTYMDNGECEDTRISEYLKGYKFVAHELVVVSDMNEYQGRLDAVLRMNDRNILVDFKGSTKWKPKKYLGDYNHQLGAYYGACMEMGMNIDCACVVLFIDGRDKPQLYWRQLHELQQSYEEFVERVKQYKNLTQGVVS
jgi:genome maintenance exonuclease 1